MSKEVLRAVWYRLARSACRLFCNVFFRFRVYGLENVPATGAVVLAANHQSYLDPLFCGVTITRQLCFMARDTLFANKYTGRLLHSVNAIPIKRERADISAIKLIIEKLKHGWGVCLYPEGTRTGDGRIAPFKAGLGLLCRRGNAAVVPVLIEGAFECWPRHQKLFTVGSSITVCYGKAITAEQVREMDDAELVAALTQTLRGMQTAVRMEQGKQAYSYL